MNFRDVLHLCGQHFLKTSLLLFCLGICVYQLHDRISYYSDEPTSFDVIVTHNDTITFPSFTLCPQKGQFFKATLKSMRRLTDYQYDDKDLSALPFKQLGLDFDEVWSENGLDPSAVRVSSADQDFTVTSNDAMGYNGKCLTFTPDKPLKLAGQTKVRIEVNDAIIWRNDIIPDNYTDIYFKFHEAGMNQKREAFFYPEIMAPGQLTTMNVKIQKFSYTYKKTFPCQSELGADAQMMKCIDDIVNRTNISCRYPSINWKQDLIPCANMDEVYTAAETLRSIYEGADIQSCYKEKIKCRETILDFKTPTRIREVTSSRLSNLEIVIPDQTFLSVNEKFTYSVAALLSDLGGSLGFFLGLSVISLADGLQKLVEKLFSKGAKGESPVVEV